MGAGKTTIGKRLARMLDVQFIDLDIFIESRHRKKVSEIFAEKGESGFREIERDALREVRQFDNVVISTGGGTPCFFDNMQVMNEAGQTIYLKLTPNELATRLIKSNKKGTRPLLSGKSDNEILQFVIDSLAVREPFYSQSTCIFEAGNLDIEEKLELLAKNLAN